MGSISREVGLELRLFSAARTAGGFLREAAAAAAAAGDEDAGADKLEGFLRALDDEKRKIEAFKRELPLCRLLVRDVIRVLKKELDQCRKGGNCVAQQRRQAEVDEDCKDKRSWMSSAQLWNNGCSNEDDEKKITQEVCPSFSLITETRRRRSPSDGGAIAGFKQQRRVLGVASNLRGEEGGGEAHAGLAGALSPVAAEHEQSELFWPSLSLSELENGGQPVPGDRRWQRHRPKPARPAAAEDEAVLVAGAPPEVRGRPPAARRRSRLASNDEVKSHLQKYRLHPRRRSPASATAAAVSSPSGSPQSPLQLAGVSRAISLTAGDSYEEEDGRSESFSSHIKPMKILSFSPMNVSSMCCCYVHKHLYSSPTVIFPRGCRYMCAVLCTLNPFVTPWVDIESFENSRLNHFNRVRQSRLPQRAMAS